MKVFVDPTGLHSFAMVRVARALKETKPASIEIVNTPDDADLRVMHVIGPERPLDRKYMVIQYCGSTTQDLYQTLWKRAQFVWSYYQLDSALLHRTPFMFAPLGIDRVFHKMTRREGKRTVDLVTSGYSSGPIQEAIEEAVFAIEALGKTSIHIGPPTIEGMTRYPKVWRTQLGIPDRALVEVYQNAKRVSGLRQVEGFELPALEGLLLGARPVVFDRPDMRLWYEGLAEFVPPCSGNELIERLTMLFRDDPTPVSQEEKDWVLTRFNWATIGEMFWKFVMATTYQRGSFEHEKTVVGR